MKSTNLPVDQGGPYTSRHFMKPRRALVQHPVTCPYKVTSRPAYRVYDLRPALSMRAEGSTGEGNTTLGATVRFAP